MFHVKHFCSTGGRILFHVKHLMVACEANLTCLPGRGAVPTARGKRVDTYGFYPLNSHFLLFLSLAQIADM